MRNRKSQQMNRLVSTAICLLTFFAAVCQTASVEWLEQEHDFGAFDEDMGKVSCRFAFVNTGETALSIISARATCGCATPDFSTKPVEPGDTGYVTVSYNPTGRPGRFDKKIYVEMNTKPKKTTLLIKGVVIGASNTIRSRFPVEAGPIKLKTSVVPFGELKKGKTKVRFIDFYNTSADTLRPYFKDLPDYLSATLKDGIVAPGDYASFAMTIDTSKIPEYGMFTDSVVFVPDADMEQQSVVLSVVAMIAEDFSGLSPKKLKNAPIAGIVPDGVDCGTIIRNNGKIAKSITIKNHGNDNLIIRRAYTTDKGISIKVSDTTIKKGKTARIDLSIDPSQIPADILDARISIITNSPDKPVIPVRIVGEIK